MAFETAGTWVVTDRTGAIPGLDNRWARNSLALILSIVAEASLIGMLLGLDAFSPRAPTKSRAINVIDISSTTAQASGAAKADTSHPVTAAQQLSKVDTTSTTPLPREWSVAALPPAPKSDPAPVQTVPSATTGHGMGSTGTNAGAGYDPYAFASYRSPDAARLAAAAANALIPPIDKLAELEGKLRSRLGKRGLHISARATVDGTGRIIYVDILSGVAGPLVASIEAVMTNFQLVPAATGKSASSLPITLNI